MNPQEKILWQKIQNFQFDEEDTAFPFKARLARENNWTTEFTDRVIEEYKKFMFLCCVSPKNQMMTPSDEVDQVWHLHMIYTQSYWEEFCQKTLGKNIHHNPTKGGQNERVKFWDLYENTKSFYIEKFSENPPDDIWLPSQTRFSKLDFKRINFADYWVIPKPSMALRNQLAFFMVLFGGIFSIYANANTKGVDAVILFFFISVILMVMAVSFFPKHRKILWFIGLFCFTCFGIYIYQLSDNLDNIVRLCTVGIGMTGIGYLLIHLRGKKENGRSIRRFISIIGCFVALFLFLAEIPGAGAVIGIISAIVLVSNIESGGGGSGGSSWIGCGGGCSGSDSGCASGCGSGCGGCGGCGG